MFHIFCNNIIQSLVSVKCTVFCYKIIIYLVQLLSCRLRISPLSLFFGNKTVKYFLQVVIIVYRISNFSYFTIVYKCISHFNRLQFSLKRNIYFPVFGCNCSFFQCYSFLNLHFVILRYRLRQNTFR